MPLRYLLLLLALLAPQVRAEALYRVELILFRHAPPLEASQRARYDGPYPGHRTGQPRTRHSATSQARMSPRAPGSDRSRVSRARRHAWFNSALALRWQHKQRTNRPPAAVYSPTLGARRSWPARSLLQVRGDTLHKKKLRNAGRRR